MSEREREDFLTLQLEQAVKGCVSGTLAEWPSLDAALKWKGFDLPRWTDSIILRQVCKGILNRD